MSEFEERLAELERRVSVLEGAKVPTPNDQPIAPRQTADDLIRVEVRNKRYDPENSALGQYEDHIWFDCIYTLAATGTTTRAVKGVLEFGDLFGETKFRINVTLNVQLEPGRKHEQQGIGFSYNQFMEDHQWMLVNDLKDMTFNFKVFNVLFADGTSESFI